MKLTDSSPFPFGKHKGRKMKEVPAAYLDWLSGQSWLVEWAGVAEYIRTNRKYIDQELADRKYEGEEEI